ncbi:hypothetical protein F5Y01DRAFT_274884 [Xylaria sp. FL0043]|nr:hypothetical protein F5Y01DRAFT_274884 [Xylaria sp. FL0043]
MLAIKWMIMCTCTASTQALLGENVFAEPLWPEPTSTGQPSKAIPRPSLFNKNILLQHLNRLVSPAHHPDRQSYVPSTVERNAMQCLRCLSRLHATSTVGTSTAMNQQDFARGLWFLPQSLHQVTQEVGGYDSQ